MKTKYSGGNSYFQLHTADAMSNLMTGTYSPRVLLQISTESTIIQLFEKRGGISQLRPHIRLLSLIHQHDGNGSIWLVVIGHKTGHSRSQNVTDDPIAMILMASFLPMERIPGLSVLQEKWMAWIIFNLLAQSIDYTLEQNLIAT